MNPPRPPAAHPLERHPEEDPEPRGTPQVHPPPEEALDSGLRARSRMEPLEATRASGASGPGRTTPWPMRLLR
jgi:hypothetical protein